MLDARPAVRSAPRPVAVSEPVVRKPEDRGRPQSGLGGVIAVTGGAGSPGRTTVAINLATGLGAAAPTVLVEAVKRKVLLRRPGDTKSTWCWETQRRPERGRSGGPLLDEAGRVIGLASGHDGKCGYYTHAEEIHRFLKRNALDWLFEKDNR